MAGEGVLLLYRSAGLNLNAPYRVVTNDAGKVRREYYGKGGERLLPGAREYAVKTLGIKTDLDLRGPGECSGMRESPLGPEVKWIRTTFRDYGGLFGDDGKKSFKEAFAVLIDEKNYPLVFHCIAGADRTGTLAYVVEALCGVSDEDLVFDWELTALANPNVGFAHEKRYDKLVAGFLKYPGSTTGERVAAFVKSLGFTDADIARLREILLEEPDVATGDDPAKYWNFAELESAPTYRECPFAGSAYPGMKSLLVKGKGPKGAEAEFFCYYAAPGGDMPDGGFPAIVLVHGAGGTAYPHHVLRFVNAGFAVIMPDWYNQRPVPDPAAKTLTDKAVKPVPLDGGKRHDVVANVANIVLAHSLMRSFKEVNPEKTVLVGLSWGSWQGSVAAAIDGRFKGTVLIYCADRNPAQPERRALVDGRFLHAVKSPAWWIVGTNDRNVTPETSQAGFDECPKHWGHAIVPNLPHSHCGFKFESVMRMAKHFACGEPALPRLGDLSVADGVATAKILSPGASQGRAFLSYTLDRNVSVAHERKWISAAADIDGDIVRAKLPEGAYQAFLSLYEAKKGKYNDLCGSSSVWVDKF